MPILKLPTRVLPKIGTVLIWVPTFERPVFKPIARPHYVREVLSAAGRSPVQLPPPLRGLRVVSALPLSMAAAELSERALGPSARRARGGRRTRPPPVRPEREHVGCARRAPPLHLAFPERRQWAGGRRGRESDAGGGGELTAVRKPRGARESLRADRLSDARRSQRARVRRARRPAAARLRRAARRRHRVGPQPARLVAARRRPRVLPLLVPTASTRAAPPTECRRHEWLLVLYCPDVRRRRQRRERRARKRVARAVHCSRQRVARHAVLPRDVRSIMFSFLRLADCLETCGCSRATDACETRVPRHAHLAEVYTERAVCVWSQAREADHID